MWLVCYLVVGGSVAVLGGGTRWTEHQFRVPVDHFSQFTDPRPTFVLRYLDCTTFCKNSSATNPTPCPIIFYPGNEAPITAFANASGRLFELAERFSARVIFAEERYYGTSIPQTSTRQRQGVGRALGSATVGAGVAQSADVNLSSLHVEATARIDGHAYEYLSTEQVLADYAALLGSLGATETRVVAIGGSYGGMLAVYMRLKYGWLVDGALGSSAPLNGGSGGTSPSTFYDITAADYDCAADIRGAFLDLLAALRTPSGLERVRATFELCTPLLESQTDVLVAVLQAAFGTLAELDYPYAVDFITSKLPANPTTFACAAFERASGGSLVQLAAAAAVAYNSTGSSKCLAIPDDAVFEQYLPGLIDGAWT
jgi:lysosomal Pro-X carboxypeptidase